MSPKLASPGTGLATGQSQKFSGRASDALGALSPELVLVDPEVARAARNQLAIPTDCLYRPSRDELREQLQMWTPAAFEERGEGVVIEAPRRADPRPRWKPPRAAIIVLAAVVLAPAAIVVARAMNAPDRSQVASVIATSPSRPTKAKLPPSPSLSGPSAAKPLQAGGAQARQRRPRVKPVDGAGLAPVSGTHASPSPQAPSTLAGERLVRAQVVAAAERAMQVHRVDLLAQAIGGDLDAVVGVVGKPDSRRQVDRYCHAHWAHIGLTIVLTSESLLNPCGHGRVVGGLATERQWRTYGGLRVGASLRELRRLYPATESIGAGWWRLTSIGTRSRPIPLHAHVSKGRVDRLLLN